MHITQSANFQKELLHLILRKPIFSQRFYKLVAEDDDLKKMKFSFFINRMIGKVAATFYARTMKEHTTTMSRGLLENEISRLEATPDEKNRMTALIGEVWDMHIPDFRMHDSEVISFLKVVKTTLFLQENASIVAKGFEGTLDFENKTIKFLSNISRLSARSNTYVDMSDPLKVIDEYADSSNANIPFGLKEIDDVLNGGGVNGGMGRGEVTIFMSGVNQGKTVSVNTVNCHNVRVGNKVRHINLEGRRLQPAMRHIANLADINYKKLIRIKDKRALNPSLKLTEYFGNDELKRISKAEEYIKNLKIYHEIGNSSIESIESLARELYAEEAYDLLVIDYLGLVTTAMPFLKRDESLGYIVRRLEVMAAELNIAVLSPVQVNRSGLSEIRMDAKGGTKYPTYTMDMVSDSKKIVDTAATVIAYSRTKEEVDSGRGRYSIVKQREGATGLQVGIVSSFETLNMFQGERYYIGTGAEPEAAKNKPPALTKNFESMMPDSSRIDSSNLKAIYPQFEALFYILDNANEIMSNQLNKLPLFANNSIFLKELEKNIETEEKLREFVGQKIDLLISTYKDDLRKVQTESPIVASVLGATMLDDSRTLGSLVLSLKDKISPYLEGL